jgi:hypothetical protein
VRFGAVPSVPSILSSRRNIAAIMRSCQGCLGFSLPMFCDNYSGKHCGHMKPSGPFTRSRTKLSGNTQGASEEPQDRQAGRGGPGPAGTYSPRGKGVDDLRELPAGRAAAGRGGPGPAGTYSPRGGGVDSPASVLRRSVSDRSVDGPAVATSDSSTENV